MSDKAKIISENWLGMQGLRPDLDNSIYKIKVFINEENEATITDLAEMKTGEMKSLADMDDDEIIDMLAGASKLIKELEEMGYTVHG